eukprot:COSAG04_NODE_10564_length_768_cov_10.110613_1_plen_92_part_01
MPQHEELQQETAELRGARPGRRPDCAGLVLQQLAQREEAGSSLLLHRSAWRPGSAAAAMSGEPDGGESTAALVALLQQCAAQPLTAGSSATT